MAKFHPIRTDGDSSRARAPCDAVRSHSSRRKESEKADTAAGRLGQVLWCVERNMLDHPVAQNAAVLSRLVKRRASRMSLDDMI